MSKKKIKQEIKVSTAKDALPKFERIHAFQWRGDAKNLNEARQFLKDDFGTWWDINKSISFPKNSFSEDNTYHSAYPNQWIIKINNEIYEVFEKEVFEELFEIVSDIAVIDPMTYLPKTYIHCDLKIDKFQAIQWWSGASNFDEFSNFLGESISGLHYNDYTKSDEIYIDDYNRQTMCIRVGDKIVRQSDWAVKWPDNTFRSYTNDNFLKIFELN